LVDSSPESSGLPVTLTFIGSGDAFGSGGRLQTCMLVDAPETRFCLDFGASSLIGLRREGVDPNTIDAIVLTHLHGDHCGGVPFLLLDAMLGSRRTSPLTVLGPAGVEAHLDILREALFPGSGGMLPRFPVGYVEVVPGEETRAAGLSVSAVEARHARESHPSAIRVSVGGVTIAYTGDGELTDDLRRLVSGVDLLVAESYFFDKPVRGHLNYPDLVGLSARRMVLTHMHSSMLEQVDNVPETCAYDGYRITIG
jgi:ribonuclease BN (tRNA processing enzyme)